MHWLTAVSLALSWLGLEWGEKWLASELLDDVVDGGQDLAGCVW